MNIALSLTILICGFLLTTAPTHAYLDPGSGSFIFQMIIGALLGGAFTLKLYFKKISLFLSRVFSKRYEKEKEDEKHK